MADFPQTTEQLDEYIDAYMQANIAERMPEITAAAIRDAVFEYMRSYGASMEENGQDGEVPLIDEVDKDNTTVPVAILTAGKPSSYAQARIRLLAEAAASLITAADILTPIVEQTQTAVTINPNVANVWNTPVASLNISFGDAKSGFLNEYMLRFTTLNGTFRLILPTGATWEEEPEWEAGVTYEVSIVGGRAVYGAWGG